MAMGVVPTPLVPWKDAKWPVPARVNPRPDGGAKGPLVVFRQLLKFGWD